MARTTPCRRPRSHEPQADREPEAGIPSGGDSRRSDGSRKTQEDVTQNVTPYTPRRNGASAESRLRTSRGSWGTRAVITR